MRTYRLQFSSDPRIVQRRLEKATASVAERILARGFQEPPPKGTEPRWIWAWEGDFQTLAPPSWDEYHFVVQDPSTSVAISEFENSFLVLQPQRARQKSLWLKFLKSLSGEVLHKRTFLEIEPWSKEKPAGFTAAEVASFLYELRYHFPKWAPCRRPGVELWDSRIADKFELESSQWQEHFFHKNPETPKISVIIPTFNNKYFVHKVVEHLGHQDLPSADYEVIVVDDGGSDSTLEYFKLFGVPHNLRLRYVYWPKPRADSSGAQIFRAGLCRNLGVRLARGEQLVFLDSDMLVPSSFLSRVVQELQFSDVLQFPRFHIPQEDSVATVAYEKMDFSRCYIEEENYWKPFFETANWMAMEKFWKYTCTYALAMKKENFLAAGRFCRFYVSYGFEDTELGYRLAKLNKKFQLVSLNLLHLTSYSHSQYQFSKAKRHHLLQRTAKQFFLSTLDLENFHHLQGFMGNERALWPRLKSALDFRDKNKSSDANLSARHSGAL